MERCPLLLSYPTLIPVFSSPSSICLTHSQTFIGFSQQLLLKLGGRRKVLEQLIVHFLFFPPSPKTTSSPFLRNFELRLHFQQLLFPTCGATNPLFLSTSEFANHGLTLFLLLPLLPSCVPNSSGGAFLHHHYRSLLLFTSLSLFFCKPVGPGKSRPCLPCC